MNATTDTTITVRRLGANEAAASAEALAEVLIDCVQGGASVSFMAPLPRDKALAFWRGVAEGVARNERVLLVARMAPRASSAPCSSSPPCPTTSPTAPTWPRCWCTARPGAAAWPSA